MKILLMRKRKRLRTCIEIFTLYVNCGEFSYRYKNMESQINNSPHIYKNVENNLDEFRFNFCYICVCYAKWLFVFQTYIGNVVVSVNPYKKLALYTTEVIHAYQRYSMYELPPHM